MARIKDLYVMKRSKVPEISVKTTKSGSFSRNDSKPPFLQRDRRERTLKLANTVRRFCLKRVSGLMKATFPSMHCVERRLSLVPN